MYKRQDGGTADIQLQGKVLKNNMSLTVIVYDAKTWDEIPHAKVALQSEKNYAETNYDGKVTLTGLVEQQTYDIFISYVGYESQKISYQCIDDNAEIKVYPVSYTHLLGLADRSGRASVCHELVHGPV